LGVLAVLGCYLSHSFAGQLLFALTFFPPPSGSPTAKRSRGGWGDPLRGRSFASSPVPTPTIPVIFGRASYLSAFIQDLYRDSFYAYFSTFTPRGVEPRLSAGAPRGEGYGKIKYGVLL
jgi:hypothetical protein